MALVLKDRVKVTTTTTGTGAFAIGGAQFGFQGFSAFADGDTTYYTAVDNATGAWETGVGTYSSTGPTLARTTVLDSSNAGGLVNFGVGPKDLFVVYPAGRAVSTAGNVTLTGNLNVPSINGGQLAGMRNKIINGAFGINQRGYVSGAATTAGQYTLDRWKVTSTGGITFSTTANKTTVTIPSGQTLQQVIEGLNLQTGTYVLSWEGTAQGRIAGGAYGASGAVTASITGGTNTTIEFNAGTVANVQLELGTIATPFEHRPYGAEWALCERYYLIRIVIVGTNMTDGANQAQWHWVPMRATPTITLSSGTGGSLEALGPTGARALTNASGFGGAGLFADAEL